MANAAASSLKAVTMELGGKSPLIVFEDANVNLAADIAMMANFYSSGQVCTNGTRVFIPARMKSAFEQTILSRVARIRAGDLFDPPPILARWSALRIAKTSCAISKAVKRRCNAAVRRRGTDGKRVR